MVYPFFLLPMQSQVRVQHLNQYTGFCQLCLQLVPKDWAHIRQYTDTCWDVCWSPDMGINTTASSFGLLLQMMGAVMRTTCFSKIAPIPLFLMAYYDYTLEGRLHRIPWTHQSKSILSAMYRNLLCTIKLLVFCSSWEEASKQKETVADQVLL